MRPLLLLALVACGGTDNSPGIDDASADASSATCDSFRDDGTYLSISSEVAVSLIGVDWLKLPNPFDPDAPPTPIFISGLNADGVREDGPIVEVDRETFRVSGVMWNGERGKAVRLEPEEDDRCQWVRAL